MRVCSAEHKKKQIKVLVGQWVLHWEIHANGRVNIKKEGFQEQVSMVPRVGDITVFPLFSVPHGQPTAVSPGGANTALLFDTKR